MNTLKTAAGILLVFTIVIGILLLNIFPFMPSSFIGWVLLTVVGIPVYLLLEGLGEIVFSEKVGQSISDKGFSGGRIIYGVAVMLIFYGAVYLIWKAAGPYIGPYFSSWFS